MNGHPRVEVSFDDYMQTEPQDAVPSFPMTVAPIGDVVAHHANSVMAGTMEVAGQERLMIQIARPGCKCGCGASGVALFHLPTIDSARAVAHRILADADRIEAAAATAASAAIAKAARK